MSPTATTPASRLSSIPSRTDSAICSGSRWRRERTMSTHGTKPSAWLCGCGPMWVRSRWVWALTSPGIRMDDGRLIRWSLMEQAASC